MPMAGDCFAALAMTDYGSAQVQPPRANPRTMLRTLALSLAAALLPLSGAAVGAPGPGRFPAPAVGLCSRTSGTDRTVGIARRRRRRGNPQPRHAECRWLEIASLRSQ